LVHFNILSLESYRSPLQLVTMTWEWKKCANHFSHWARHFRDPIRFHGIELWIWPRFCYLCYVV